MLIFFIIINFINSINFIAINYTIIFIINFIMVIITFKAVFTKPQVLKLIKEHFVFVTEEINNKI